MKGINTSKNKLVLCLFIFSLIISSCASSRRSISVEEGWQLLAERKINFLHDKDVIQVNGHDKFTALRFRVEDRNVRLNFLKIYFDNGDKLEPSVENEFEADQNSRIIDLGVEGRYIDRIEFNYRTLGTMIKGRANLLVFGKMYRPAY